MTQRLFALVALFVIAPAAAGPANQFDAVEMRATHVAGSIHMLEGAGGNIGVSIGDDGTLIIDDQFAPLAGKIQAALDDLGGDKPRLILNTHYHGDHTGSNAHFGRDGVIVAHDNVRARLLPSAPREALPVVTYADLINVHFNGESIDLIHLPQGHTDGDTVVWFEASNVIHMGDHLFNGAFPYVDVPGGGSVTGFVSNLMRVHAMINDETQVIPGHGPLGNRADIERAVEVITKTRTIVLDHLANGTVDELKAEGFGAEYESWGRGFIGQDRWIDIVIESQLADR